MKGEDPFAALEEAAAKQAATERALKSLSAARCRLVLGRDARSAFFATLALRLVPEPDWLIETLSTDGRKLSLNPGYVNGLSAEELVGVVAHEVLHNALAHHARRGNRDRKRWNVACDLAVNPVLLDAGFALPPGRLLPGEGKYSHLPPGRSAEEYYDLLAEQGQGTGTEAAEEEGGEEASPDPGRCGGVSDPGNGSPAEARQSQAEWGVAAAQAQQIAKGRGELPAGLSRAVGEALQPKAEWKEVLRQFVSSCARNDYSWSPPNKRFLHAGLYLPGLRSEELGEVVLAVDTSGSISERELARFAAEAQAILESFDCSLTVLYHDTDVQKVQRWQSADGPLILEPAGGGGTSHACVFEWIEREGAQPACVVCLTDLETAFPDTHPGVPVLWAVVGDNRSRPPFGLRVDLGP